MRRIPYLRGSIVIMDSLNVLNVWLEKCHKVVKIYVCTDQPEASLISHLFSLKTKANRFPSEAVSNQGLSIIYIIIVLFSSAATLPKASCWRIHKAAPENTTFSPLSAVWSRQNRSGVTGRALWGRVGQRWSSAQRYSRCFQDV